MKIQDFSWTQNHNFTTRSVYYVGATDCLIFRDRKSAEIVLAPEAEQERFRRSQEQALANYFDETIDFIRFCDYNVEKYFSVDKTVLSTTDVTGGLLMAYLSIAQTSERWGISPRRIQILCRDGRVNGAVRIGHSWAIPDDAPKPTDARIKSGKYVKEKMNEKFVD